MQCNDREQDWLSITVRRLIGLAVVVVQILWNEGNHPIIGPKLSAIVRPSSWFNRGIPPPFLSYRTASSRVLS